MEKSRQLWADILRILAIFCVILIHSAAPLLTRYEEITIHAWWIGNLYNSISRWCIPVFFMLSGTFLIQKAGTETPFRFYLKRLKRIFIPFVIWSGIYFLWRIYVNNENLNIALFFPLLIKEPVYYHLWFIYVLMELYLFAPVISSYIRSSNRNNQFYFLFLWFSINSIFPALSHLYNAQTYFQSSMPSQLFIYSGYFILGYFIRGISIQRFVKKSLVLVFISAFFITASGTWYLTVYKNNGDFDQFFYEYFSFNVALMAISIFLIVKCSRLPQWIISFENRHSFVGKVARCVPGIYFLHAIVIAVFKRGFLGFSFDELTISPSAGIPVFATTVFLISLILTTIIKTIPGVKHIVP